MSRKSMDTSSSFCSTSSPSPFRWETQIPSEAVGLVIGKGGATIKRFHNIPGVSSVNFARNRIIQVSADSQEALDTAVDSIVERVVYHLTRRSGFIPQVSIFCFCKSPQDPLLSIDKVSLETVSDPIPDLSEEQCQPQWQKFCFSSGEISQEGKNGMVDNADGLTSEVYFCLQWDFSAYRAKLRSCLEPLIFTRHETLRSIKLVLRYGKLLFYGSELQEDVPVAVERLHDLCRRKSLSSNFLEDCWNSAVKLTNFVHQLQTLGYRKVSARKKIIMQVTDLENVYDVFVRVEGEDLEQSVALTKVRTDRRREALVTFSREGPAATDFRLAITSFGQKEEPVPEMAKLIESAFRNRSPEGVLVLGSSSGRFLARNITYVEVDTYLSEDWKLRVVQTGDTDGRNPLSYRWDCVSSSRWFNKNAHNIEGEEGMDYALANMEAFVKEGAKLSCLLDVN